MIKVFKVFFIATILIWAIPLGRSMAEDILYKSYSDEMFGYSIEYPDIFGEGDHYVDGDGFSNFELRSGNGEYHVLIWGGKKGEGLDGASLLKEATDMTEDEFGYVYGVQPLPGSDRSGADFYSLEYETDRTGKNSIVHRYGIVGKDATAVYELCYPTEEAERFAEIKKHMDQSFKIKN